MIIFNRYCGQSLHATNVLSLEQTRARHVVTLTLWFPCAGHPIGTTSRRIWQTPSSLAVQDWSFIDASLGFKVLKLLKVASCTPLDLPWLSARVFGLRQGHCKRPCSESWAVVLSCLVMSCNLISSLDQLLRRPNSETCQYCRISLNCWTKGAYPVPHPKKNAKGPKVYCFSVSRGGAEMAARPEWPSDAKWRPRHVQDTGCLSTCRCWEVAYWIYWASVSSGYLGFDSFMISLQCTGPDEVQVF